MYGRKVELYRNRVEKTIKRWKSICLYINGFYALLVATKPVTELERYGFEKLSSLLSEI